MQYMILLGEAMLTWDYAEAFLTLLNHAKATISTNLLFDV